MKFYIILYFGQDFLKHFQVIHAQKFSSLSF